MCTRPRPANTSQLQEEEEEAHTNTTNPLYLPPRRCGSTDTVVGRMLLLRSTAPFSYAKVDKVDAGEARHWKAQFLIHKVLEGKTPAPALARGSGGCRVVRAARIGVRLKRLRLAARTVSLRVYRSVHKRLRNLRRLARGIGSPRS